MANKENIRKWVEALRSGKYRQITQKLSDGEGYCCLGIACEVAIENGVRLSKSAAVEDAEHGKIVTYGDDVSELPPLVGRWLGLEYENEFGHLIPQLDPGLPTPDLPKATAISWNDSEKADFAKIADLIEAVYLKEELLKPEQS